MVRRRRRVQEQVTPRRAQRRRWAFIGMVLLATCTASLGGCRTEEERRLPDACESYLSKVKRCGGGPAPAGMRERLQSETDDKKLEARCKSASHALEAVCP